MNTQISPSSQEIQDLYLEFLEYLGTKPGNDIPGILIEMESKIKDLLEGREYLLHKYGENRDSVERKIMHKITGDSINISNLLETLAQRVQEILKKSPEEIDREMGIFVKELEGIILPPGEGNMQAGNGESEIREEKELSESRYGKILEILRENEIYADDIIVYMAQLQRNQMRQTSYRVIQIPRLSKTIFVCDEYGEASFVVDSLVYSEVFLEHTKSDIREKLAGTRIIHSFAWETRLSEALFGTPEERKTRSASEKAQTKKIDVRKMEEYREEILRQFPCPEDWIRLTQKEKATLKILGKGLTAIATIFGASGNMISYSSSMALLGQKIYGEGYIVLDIELWGTERWKEEILKQLPTPDDWMKLTAIQRRLLKVCGKSLSSIYTVFGITGNPTRSSSCMLSLGQKIYGGDKIFDSYLEEDMTVNWTEKQWRGEILKHFPTPNDWMKLTARQRGLLKVSGKGLIHISRIFGIHGNTVNYSRNATLLGQKIYGGDKIFDSYLEEDMTVNWTQEQWKEEILKKYSTPEEWMSLNHKQKKEFKVHGRGLKAVSRIFGISGGPVGNAQIMALLGEKIYGSHPIFDRYIKNKE